MQPEAPWHPVQPLSTGPSKPKPLVSNYLFAALLGKTAQVSGYEFKSHPITVATTEADEAIASCDFLKIMGISNEKGAKGMTLASFDHFASSDFNVQLRSCTQD